MSSCISLTAEEFGGHHNPVGCLKGLTKPDLMVAAGFSYEVVTAHNGCLQMEVTVHGKVAHATVPHTGVDALQAATAVLDNMAKTSNTSRSRPRSPASSTPYVNVGRHRGRRKRNVIPGKVVLKIDRRMIPEENPAEVRSQHPQGDDRCDRCVQHRERLCGALRHRQPSFSCVLG